MKTRTDFVSNSSSCSFVIKDVKNALTAIKSLGTDGFIPYELDDIDLHVYAKRSVIKELFDILERTPSHYDDFNHNLDDEDSYGFNLSALESIPDSIMQKIDYIYLQCDDYEQTKVLYLSVLYMFLKNEGVDVDCSDSEHELMFQDGDTSFLGKMLKKAFK